MNTRILANIIAETIGEVEAEIPEGILYAGVMAHCHLDQFQAIISTLHQVGLIERRAGPTVIATPKLRAIVAKAKTAGIR